MPTKTTPDWRRDVREGSAITRAVGWRAAIWVIAVVIFAGVIGGGIWLFKVTTSGIKGAGDQTRIVNDGRNRVNAQEWFVGQYEQIRSTDRRIDQAATELAAKPGDEFAATNYRGLINRCMEMVGNYNAEAMKVSRAQWIDAALPTNIGDSDPATDCQPTAQPSPATR